MLQIKAIQSRHFAILAAFFIACIGTFDIVSDALNHNLSLFNFIFNFVLLLPLITRHRVVYAVFGWLAAAFSLYILFALLVFLGAHLNGNHVRSVFDTFVVGPIFAIATMAAGIVMIRTGMQKKKGEQSPTLQ